MDWNIVIRKIKAGDYKELEKVYTEYRQEFFKWMIKQFKCPHSEVQEIYQMSMIAFYENIVNDRITNLSSGLKTYLFAIGKHKYFELSRDKHKLNIELDENLTIETEENLENTPEELHFVSELETSLQKIGDPCKSILELYYYHKKSMQDIATQLGLKNSDTAKNMKYKCLQRLKGVFTVSKT